MYKQLYKLGYVGYIFLFALSVIFYKEREIFPDTSFQMFYMLSKGTFFFENHFRYGLALTEVYPLLASKIGLSLAAVAVIHSLSFVFNHLLCYFLCGSVFKNYRMALVLLLFHTLFIADSFFWPISDLPPGISYMMVFFAYVLSKGGNKLSIPVIAIMGVATFILISFFHPLTIFPYAFFLAFFFLRKDKPGVKLSTIVTLLILFIISYVLREHYFVSSHDTEATSLGLTRVRKLFPHYLDLHSNKIFVRNCLGKFALMVIGFLLVTITYLRQRAWLKLLMFVGFTGGYLMLVNITYSDGSTPAFYIENLYLPIAIFIAIPLVFDCIPQIQHKKMLAPAILSFIVLILPLRIVNMSDRYVKRLNWEREFLAKNQDKKLLISEKHVPMDVLMMTWCTPYEFWLLSTIETGKTASITIAGNVDDMIWGASETNSFLPVWGLFRYSALPPQYFVFKDTVNGYTIIK